MHDVNACHDGANEFRKLLENAREIGCAAASRIKHDEDDIPAQAKAAIDAQMLMVHDARLGLASVELLRPGMQGPRKSPVHTDTVRFDIPYFGRWDLALAALRDARASVPTSLVVGGARIPTRIEADTREGVLRVYVETKVFYVPGDERPDPRAARETGRTLREAVLRCAVDLFAFARVRHREVEECNAAIRQAIEAYADKARAFNASGKEFLEGIGLPVKELEPAPFEGQCIRMSA